MASNSKLSSPFTAANAALHHAPLAFDQLELAEPEQIAHMIDAAGRAFLRDFLVFGENGWQLELLNTTVVFFAVFYNGRKQR